MTDLILQTSNDYTLLFLRVVAGIIIFPYGMQKLFGWFDDLGGGIGIKESLERLKKKKVPVLVGWLIIIGQSFGSIALILGCLGRVAALGNFIIFTGALISHIPEGWTLNWLGKKKGEGIEYFILLLSLLLIIIIRGSGPLSVDFWLQSV
ncbi:DoxX family protein [Mucilaginibacter sp.]|jgi:putative oxidoreductase|uniref:DoxX family protein n=1 Tax=Mucilaginibacter sp. TaxID=1882438 RepID=UPI003564F2F0